MIPVPFQRRLGGLGLLALLAVCAGTSTAPLSKPATVAQPLADTAWILQSLPGVAVLRNGAPTLRFEGGQAQGSGGLEPL